MNRKSQYRIEMIPLSRKTRDVIHPYSFPAFTDLYLELLENKEKVKPNLVNKFSDKKYITRSFEERYKSSKYDDLDDYKEDYEEMTKEEEHTPTANKYEENDYHSEPQYDQENKQDSSSSSSSSVSSSSSEEAITSRLEKLLKDDSPESINKFKSHELRQEIHNNRHNRPPTLAELQRQGIYRQKNEPVNLNYVSEDSHKIEEQKRELLFQFELLKKKYQSSTYETPQFTIHSDLDEMKKEYEFAVKRLSIDSSLTSNKKILFLGFYMIEMLFGNYLKLDMNGFAKEQMINISVYDRLLIELGEKSYVPTGSTLPVEVRIIGLIIFQAAVFLILKMASRSGGVNLLSVFAQATSNSLSGNSNTTKSHFSPPQNHRTMNGPDIIDL